MKPKKKVAAAAADAACYFSAAFDDQTAGPIPVLKVTLFAANS
jgi:hypothetical protein